MAAHSFTLFDTAVGRCGIAWGERGIAGVQLPEADDLKTRTRLLRRFPQASEAPPPPDMERAIAAIVALLRGEAADLSVVVLDLTGIAEFDRSVYEMARAIPPGATLTYGEIAARLGDRSLRPRRGACARP